MEPLKTDARPLSGGREPEVDDERDAAASAIDAWDILNSLPAAVYATDAEGRITFYNRAAADFSGRLPQLGRDRWCVSWKLFSKDGSPLSHDQCPMAVAIKEDRPVRGVEAIAERPDGNRIPFMPLPTPLHDANGRLVGAVNMLVDISEMKHAEQELRSRQHELDDFFENAVVPMHLVAADGTILQANRAEFELLGYSSDEYIGHHIAEFHADQDIITNILNRLSCGEKLDKQEARLRAKNGSIKEVLISSNVLFRDGQFIHTRCVSLDVTEQKRAERRQRADDARLRIIYERASAGIAEVDLQGRFLAVNDRFCMITGYPPEALIGRPFGSITHADDRPGEQQRFTALAAGELDSYQATKRFLRIDARPIWVELSCALVRDAQGRPERAIRVVQDITELKRAEARQNFLLEELNHRVKNMLTMVLSLASQTAGRAADLPSFIETFQGRIGALNRAHDLLTQGIGTGASLGQLVRETVACLLPAQDRVVASGPAIQLRAEIAVVLAVAFHELATNAIKHGALSVPGGRVSIHWSLQGSGADRMLDLLWAESGGPPVTAPERRGFGSTLIERALGMQLNGRAKMQFHATGLQCRIEASADTVMHSVP